MANARIRTKPIILFDDVNSPLEKNGPFGSFIYGVSQLCQESNVICYVLTNNRQAAYQIWQLNGGNFIRPHDAVSEQIRKPATLAEWALHDTSLSQQEVGAMDNEDPGILFLAGAFCLRQYCQEDSFVE